MWIPGRLLGVVVSVVAALPLAACGGDDEASEAPTTPARSSPSYDPQEQRRKDATANLTDFFSVYAPLGEYEYFTREQAACIAERVVEEPGLRRLQKVGVLNDELQYVIDADPKFPRADAEAITSAIFGCSNAEQVLRRQSVKDLDGATASQRACAADHLTDDLLASLFTLALQKKPLGPAVQDVAEAFAPCRDA